MILAHHIIMTSYGFWLPNDPRGSWSDFVSSWELLRFGEATTVRTRRSPAHEPHHDVRMLRIIRCGKEGRDSIGHLCDHFV